MAPRGKFNLISILSSRLGPARCPGQGVENVDAARPCLYKTPQWRWGRSRRRCSLSVATAWAYLRAWQSRQSNPKTISVDQANRGLRVAHPRSVTAEGHL